MENQHIHSTDYALLNLYKIGAITATILSMLMSIVLFARSMQEGTRYFQSTAAVKCTLVIFAINVCFAATAFIVFRRGESRPVIDMGLLKYTFMFPAVAAAACIFSTLYGEAFTSIHALMLVCALGSILFALSHIINIPASASIISAYVQLAFYLLIISRLYVDFSVEMNAPIKVFIQLTAAVAMINTLSDTRFFIGRESVRLFSFSKISFLILAVFTFAGSLIEVAPDIARYGKDYIIFPFYFMCACIPNAIQFFVSVLEARKQDTAPANSEAGEV